MERAKMRGLLLALAVLLLLAVIVRTAWVCDDAYITFRTVDNLLHGHGLTWNSSERVQTYTHPLWLFLLSLASLLSGDLFYTSIVLGAAVSLAAVLLLALRLSAGTAGALLGILALTLSKAFIDYSTAGLETPLTNLLLALFLLVYFRTKELNIPTLRLLSFLAALGALNRMDAILFYLPVLGYAFFKTRRWRSAALALLVGFIPFILWELFSLFYYGFPLPNSAYAKLNTGFPSSDLIRQGLRYFLNSASIDPLTLLTVAAGITIPLLWRHRRSAPVALGVVLYLFYILRIGGDFMSGRFFAAPMFCAVAVLMEGRTISRRLGGAILLVVLIVGLTPRVLSHRRADPQGAKVSVIGSDGIADERIYYAAEGALFKPKLESGSPLLFWERSLLEKLRLRGPSLIIEGAVGALGYYAGPDMHIVDYFAVTDPLLARLPALRFDPNFALHGRQRNYWRIGHFLRAIPGGYLETLITGENRIGDKRLATYYDKLSLVTRGELFSSARLAEIWRLNTGSYADAVEAASYRDPIRVALMEMGDLGSGRTPMEGPRGIRISYNGIQVRLPSASLNRRIGVGLDGNDTYLLVYYRGDAIAALQAVQPQSATTRGITRHELAVPRGALNRGYDMIGIFPMAGDGRFAVGALELLD